MARTMRRTPDHRVVRENDAKGLKRGQVVPVDLTEDQVDEQAEGLPDVLDEARSFQLWLESGRA